MPDRNTESHREKDSAGIPKSRLLIVGGVFCFLLFLIMIRLHIVCLTPIDEGDPGTKAVVRAPLLDRNGYYLASSLDTFSVYAHPKKVIDKK